METRGHGRGTQCERFPRNQSGRHTHEKLLRRYTYSHGPPAGTNTLSFPFTTLPRPGVLSAQKKSTLVCVSLSLGLQSAKRSCSFPGPRQVFSSLLHKSQYRHRFAAYYEVILIHRCRLISLPPRSFRQLLCQLVTSLRGTLATTEQPMQPERKYRSILPGPPANTSSRSLNDDNGDATSSTSGGIGGQEGSKRKRRGTAKACNNCREKKIGVCGSHLSCCSCHFRSW